MSDIDYGPLGAALAKAQAAFPPITRDKTVTVTPRKRPDGSQPAPYTFKYAPLDDILGKTRKPLADNGLSLLQLLDEDVLVTTLLHESGAMISGRTPIPATTGIQEYGSSITYLRRYAIQAILGIAAEEDDDGNAAAGNRATFGKLEQTHDGSLIGNIDRGKAPWDLQVRQTPKGNAYGFALKSGRQNIRVTATGPLADALAVIGEDALLGKRATCYGTVTPDEWVVNDGAKRIPYTRLDLSRIETAEFILPAETDAALAAGPGAEPQNPSAPIDPEIAGLPLFGEDAA